MARPDSPNAPLPLIAVAGLAAALAVVPVAYLGVRLAEAGVDGVAAVLARPRLPLLLLNTVRLVVCVTLASVALGVASAVVLVRVRVPARRAFAVLSVLPLAVPSYLTGFGWAAAVPGIHGFAPSWAVLTVVTTPFVTLAVTAALRDLPPAFEDVARTLGLGRWRRFARVTWPAVRTPAAAGGLLAGLYALSDFGGVALFRYPVLTTAVHQAYSASFDRGYAAVLAVLLVLVALVLFSVERRLRARRAVSVGRSSGQRTLAGGAWSVVGVLILLIAPAGAVGVPVAVLLVRLATAETVRALDVPELIEAVGTTAALAACGALIALILAAPIATLAAHHRGVVVRVIETVSSLPLALPGIVVGLGLVFFALNAVPVLYQTASLLAFAYGVLFLPKTVGTVRGALERVPPGLHDVAATLGYGPVSRWWRVTLRLARPGILAAALFTAVTAMKELPATLMLRPTGMPTLAVELWSRTDVSAYGAAVPYALALVLLAAVPAMLLTPRESRLVEPGARQ